MKKFLLSLVALALSCGAFASAPVYQWSKLIDSHLQQDMVSKVVVTTDGNIVSLAHFGSSSDTDGIEFDGVQIATGSATTSTSDNRNLLIIKHNAATGERMWNIYSKAGYIDVSSEGSIIATRDGGLLLLLNARSAQVSPFTSPMIVDATGAEIEFPEWNTSVAIYNQILLKVAFDGRVEWAKSIAMDQLPVPNASSGNSVNATTNGVSPYALAEDEEGNIYIGGNYRASMILTAHLNATYVFTPRNIDTYNGDTQSAAGGLYIIRLDSEGNYLNHLRASGTLTRDQIKVITVGGDKVYFAGNVRGNADDKLTIGGKSIVLENSYDGILLGCASRDLKTVDYLTYIKPHLTGTKTSNSTKIRALDLNGSSLYLIGGGQGGYSPANESAAKVISSSNGLEEGWFIELNASDGSWKNAVNNATNIGAYLGSFVYNGNLYVYGYRLNAATGCFLDEYSLGSTERMARHNLVLAGGAPTGYGMAFDPKSTRVVFCARGNKAFKMGADEVETAAPTGWGGVVAAFVMDPTLAGIENVAVEAENGLKIAAVDGAIMVYATQSAPLTVTDMNGINVVNTQVQEGETRIALPAGIYIAAGHKLAVR